MLQIEYWFYHICSIYFDIGYIGIDQISVHIHGYKQKYWQISSIILMIGPNISYIKVSVDNILL